MQSALFWEHAEDGSKAQIILSDNDRLPLGVYAEQSPTLESRCDGFSVHRKGWRCHNQVALICAVNAALQKP